ncbi:MAG TPA: L,D-transpeptidase family protein [Stellaceae bacterium]|jgi:lipoprotein-anchoring transpeptidase ErfK/SrfK
MRTTRAWLTIAVAFLISAPVAENASAARHHHAAAAPRSHATAAQKKAPAIDQNVLQAEVLLDRAGFSPGTIDGRDGDNFAKALHAFQQVNGLPVGRLDSATLERLGQVGGGPVVGEYTIQPQDVAGPFVPEVPKQFVEMAQLPQVGYRSPRQLIAAKFHMSEGLLAALNPDKNFTEAGTVLSVANVPHGGDDPAVVAQALHERRGGTGSSTPPGQTAARVVVDKQNRSVQVFSADNRLLAFFPASIGSAEKPAPSGALQVTRVDYDPTYTYDPAYHFKEQKIQRKVTVKPGPNNPVGVVWIALSAKGYGIHGTPDPDAVGKTQSHGCIRLTNWDALTLARLVKKGTPVDFIG